MKHIALVLILVTCSFAISAQTVEDLVKIKFSSTTPRTGFTEEIIVSKDSVWQLTYSKRNPDKKNANTFAIEKSDWEKLIKQIKSVDIKSIETLKSPTNKRATDGARHSEIVFTTKCTKELVHLFDDDKPNEKLVPLLQQIKNVAKN